VVYCLSLSHLLLLARDSLFPYLGHSCGSNDYYHGKWSNLFLFDIGLKY
jgi:hypothetical protein